MSNWGWVLLKEEKPLSYELLALVFLNISERNTTGKIRDFTFKLLAPLLIRIETRVKLPSLTSGMPPSEWLGEPD